MAGLAWSDGPAKWARNTTQGTYSIMPKKVAPPTHRNSRRVPMQHQHSRATLESYLNARNIMAKEL